MISEHKSYYQRESDEYVVSFKYFKIIETWIQNNLTDFQLIDTGTKLQYRVQIAENLLLFKFPREVIFKDIGGLDICLKKKLLHYKQFLDAFQHQCQQKIPSNVVYLQHTPTHLIFGLNFEGFAGLALFCLSTFIGNPIFNDQESDMKIHLVKTENHFEKYKQPPLNLHILTYLMNCNFEKLAITLQNTFIPIQVLYNLIYTTLDDNHFLHIMSFIPNEEFGIFHFSYKSERQFYFSSNLHIVIQLISKFEKNKYIFEIRHCPIYMQLFIPSNQIKCDLIKIKELLNRIIKTFECYNYEDIKLFFYKMLCIVGTYYLLADDKFCLDTYIESLNRLLEFNSQYCIELSQQVYKKSWQQGLIYKDSRCYPKLPKLIFYDYMQKIIMANFFKLRNKYIFQLICSCLEKYQQLLYRVSEIEQLKELQQLFNVRWKQDQFHLEVRRIDERCLIYIKEGVLIQEGPGQGYMWKQNLSQNN